MPSAATAAPRGPGLTAAWWKRQAPPLAAVALGLLVGVPACAALSHVSPFAPLGLVLGLGYLALAVTAPDWALVGVGLLIPLESTQLPLGGGLGALSPARAALLVVAGGWVARALLWPRRVVGVGWRDLPALALLGSVPLGLAFHAGVADVAKVSVNWGAYLVASLVVRELDLRRLRRVLVGLGVGGAVLGVEGVVGYVAGGGAHLSNGGAAVYGRAAAGLADSNYYAGLLLLLLVPLMALAVRDQGRQRVVPVVLVVLMTGGVLLSLSRGATIALLLSGAMVLLAWTGSRRVTAAALAVLVTVLAVNAGPLLASPEVQVVGERLSSVQTVSGTNTRPLLWKASIGLIQRHPEGVGVLGFPREAEVLGLTELGKPLDHAHNSFLNIGVELGVAGLVAYLALLVQVLVVLWRERRRGDPRTAALAVGLSAAMVGFAFQSVTVSLYAVQLIHAVFFLLVGASLGLARHRDAAAPTG